MWVRLLTRRHGVVRAFAFGGSRSRRRFSGCLDVMNFLRVRAVTSGNGRFLNLEEGVLVEGPQRLRSDLTRLGMAMNCVRFLEAMDPPEGESSGSDALNFREPFRGVSFGKIPPEGESAVSGLLSYGASLEKVASAGASSESALPTTETSPPETDSPHPATGSPQETPDPFALMHSLFTRLEAPEPVSDALPVLFRLRLASDQGYAPPFAVCAACDKPLAGVGGVFSIAEGVLLCPECGGRSRQNLWVSAPALDVLAEVQATLPETWQPERLLPSQRRECLRLVDAFVQYHLGLTWDRGRFRRS